EEKEQERERQVQRGQEDVELLDPRQAAAEQQPPALAREKLARAARPLHVPHTERTHRLREFLEADHVLCEAAAPAGLAGPERKRKVLADELRKSARICPRLAANERAVAEQHDEAIVVPQRVVPAPVTVHTGSEVARERAR